MNSRVLTLLLLTVSLPVSALDKTGAAAAAETKNPTLAQMLTWALQDEWAARAEYQAILKKWPGARPFSNIIQAEQTHIGWLIPLFSAQGLAVPVEPKIQVLVPEDWTKALSLGVEAEVANITMYENFLKAPLPDTLRTVFEELKRGSENHLRAFQGGGKAGKG